MCIHSVFCCNELFTGTTPLSPEQLRETSLTQLLRLIQECDPTRPSERLLSDAEHLNRIAERRNADPKALVRLIQEDLDWIVMRALEKDPHRRYETVSGLAADLQRFLNDEPVEARPPSLGYRFHKFARRHRVLFSSTLTVLVVLMAATAISIHQAFRANRERDRAVIAERKAAERLVSVEQQRELIASSLASSRRAEARAEAARHRAETDRKLARQAEARAAREATVANAIELFLRRDLLSHGSPEVEPDRNIKLRTLLDRANERIEGRFQEQPEVEAGLRRTLGLVSLSLGEYAMARLHLNRYLELQEGIRGAKHLETLAAARLTALLSFYEGRLAEGEDEARKMLEVSRKEHGEKHLETRRAMSILGMLCQARGHYAEAESLYLESYELNRRLSGAEHEITLTSMSQLTDLYIATGQYIRAKPFSRELVDALRRLAGKTHPDTLCAVHELAELHYQLGQLAVAESLLAEVLPRMRSRLGDKHPVLLTARKTLASVLASQGKLSEAEQLLTDVLEDHNKILGRDHPDTFATAAVLAHVFSMQGKDSLAEKQLEELVVAARSSLGDNHPHTLAISAQLAQVHFRQGQFTEAEKGLSNVLKTLQSQGGVSHPNTLAALETLAQLYSERGKHEDALEINSGVLQVRKRAYGPSHLTVGWVLKSITWDLLKTQQFKKAEKSSRECLAILGKEIPDSWQKHHTRCFLGISLAGQRKFNEAEPLLLDGYRQMSARKETIPSQMQAALPQAVELLILFYEFRNAEGDAKRVSKWKSELRKLSACD